MMVSEEIYILTKHGRFQADYVENLPVYKRRFYLNLMEKENEMMEKKQDELNRKHKR
jgi:hypothetical protein